MKPIARGGWRPRKTGMNGLEKRYAAELETRKHYGEVAWYAFESVKFKLADNTFYTPDFLVMLSDGTMEVHETKGFWAEHNRVKTKVAAAMFPFRFIAIKARPKKDGGGWEVEEF